MGDPVEDFVSMYISVHPVRNDPFHYTGAWRVRGHRNAGREYPGKTRTLPLAVYSEVAAGNMDRAWIYVAVILGVAFIAVWIMNMMSKADREIKM